MLIKKSQLVKIIKEEVKKSDIAEYISEKEAVDLIRSTNGKVFGVSFVKKDGSTRHMNARLNVEKYKKGGKLGYDPSKHDLIPVWDAQHKDKANAYRMINIKTITSVRVGGKKYVVKRD